MKQNEEWMVAIRHRCDKERHGDNARWANAMMYYSHSLSRRYAKSEAEARAALNHAYEIFNGVKLYDSNGKRYEYQQAGMIGVSLECDKKIDHDMEIVEHMIKKRIVTDWETVE